MLHPDDLHVVIPSRRRVPEATYCVQLWPKGKVTVCVDEVEADDYRAVGAPVVTHPPMKNGLGELRQWILDHFDSRCLVSCNDDVKGIRCLTGKRSRFIRDPGNMMQIVFNAATIAEGIGISCFGFSPTLVPFRLDPFRPFLFNRLEGALLGIIDRKLRYDPQVAQHDDVDLTLQAMLTERIVWQDARFGVEHNFMSKGGGNSISRGEERMKRELAYLKRKWGEYFGYMERKPGEDGKVGAGVPRMSTAVNVKRQQDL
jgi:hypothetical protein